MPLPDSEGTARKVFIAVPVYSGDVCYQFVESLIATLAECGAAGIKAQFEFLPGCCYVELARNVLIHRFLQSVCTDLLFIDADMAWEAPKVPLLVNLPQAIVAGAYPYKSDKEDFPVRVFTNTDGIPKGIIPDGHSVPLIEADWAPTGFMRIKRETIEQMIAAFPQMRVNKTKSDGTLDGEYYHLFRCEQVGDGWLGEDVNFCRLFRAIGGRIFIYPDIQFLHVGRKQWEGNYDKYLSALPRTEK